jgi:aspartate/methionine/tyrosine aminotransferase
MSSRIAANEGQMSRTRASMAPPIVAAKAWMAGVEHPAGRPLIDVSQAAPTDPPPEAMREAIARAALERPQAHGYGPVLGLPELRAEIATQWSADYGGRIKPAQVAITAGCNQAFCAAVAAICGEGDEVILPTPWYFNHKMWLDMSGARAVPLATGDSLLPDPDRAEALIGPRTRAIALVTPNNPGGVEYPSDLVLAFYRLAQKHGLKLIVDETYRDFDARNGAPHGLFGQPDWPETLVHLYSFSKVYRLMGHRVGALVGSESLLAEAEKFLDTVTICPAQLGQIAALWGMQHLSQWRAGERAEILARRAAIEQHMPLLEAQGWQLLGCGAFFAYMRHPFALGAEALAQQLLREASVLALPGSMFCPEDDPRGTRELRLAFANIDLPEIKQLFERLAAVRAPLAPLLPPEAPTRR